MKISSKDIIKKLVKDITSGKYKPNQKLPSEKNLEIKYGVSRAITNKVFRELKNMDLVYSVPHKGYFVAEFFASITIPNHYKYNINKINFEVITVSQKLKQFMNSKNIIFKNKKSLVKRMYSNKNYIIKAEILISKSLDLLKNFNVNLSLTDQLSKFNILNSIIRVGSFENDNTFGEKLQLVEYKIYYGKNEVLGVSRNIINHNNFKFIKKEIAI